MAMNRFSGLNLLGLPNCMGLSDTKCVWLDIKVCKGERCTFKRTTAEYSSLHTKAFERLASLSKSKQTYISEKYYNGRKPWNE